MAPREPNSASDPDRSLALLWRHTLGDATPARGPKQKTTVDAVVNTAIAIADDEGLDAFSLRKVAERLGMGVMSLYTYVPSRDDLIALMIDQVTGEVPYPALDGDLRNRLDTVGRHLWAEYRRHPWLLSVDTSRPALGPHISDRYEWELSAVEGVGIADVEMDQVVTLIAGFVASAARTARDQEATQQQSGMSDAEWWEANAPVLEKVMDGSRYPLAGRVGQAAGESYQAASNPELAFEFGLTRVLDGIMVFVDAGN